MTARTSQPIVPVFEKEVIAAAAKRRASGDEKVATTSLNYVEAHGVCLSSRYCKAHEYKDMAAMVAGVEERLRRLIESIWCDSQACACYSVQLKPCKRSEAEQIAYQLQDASRGHNGISLSGTRGGHLDLDPHWFEGDE